MNQATFPHSPSTRLARIKFSIMIMAPTMACCNNYAAAEGRSSLSDIGIVYSMPGNCSFTRSLYSTRSFQNTATNRAKLACRRTMSGLAWRNAWLSNQKLFASV